jgi:hypothetical protein
MKERPYDSPETPHPKIKSLFFLHSENVDFEELADDPSGRNHHKSSPEVDVKSC